MDILKQRAILLEKTRRFFREREFLEVETPILARAAHTDPLIEPLSTQVFYKGQSHQYFLQTSPELAMKRLLAAGMGPIYQITKAFRDGDNGRFHNLEFTMLEWYRPFYDHHQLMGEVDAYLQEVLNAEKAERIPYGKLFQKTLGIDPFYVSLEKLKAIACEQGASGAALASDKDTLLQFLLSQLEHKLGQATPCFVYDFPAEQAAMAKIRKLDGVAERFEVYFKGLELGNGFHELTDPIEQRKRFEADLHERKIRNQKDIPIDELFLKSLAHLPPCAGIAMGIDRMVMLKVGASHISEVMPFRDFT